MSKSVAASVFESNLSEEVNRSTFTLLTEEKGGRKRLYMEGEFARYDKPTNNGRFYSKDLWEQSIAKVQSKIARRGWYGELDHPGPNENTKLHRVSHVVVEAKVRDDGSVWGKAEILPTPNGKILAQLIESGCEVGVSSRGRGKEIKDASGVTEVESTSYILKAFDFVADAAQATAIPTALYESADSATDVSIAESLSDYPEVFDEIARDVHESELEAQLSSLAVTVDKNLRREFEKVLAEELERVRKEVRETTLAEATESLRAELIESIRAELESSDPVIKASKILGQIHDLTRPFVSGNDEGTSLKTEVARLQEENDQLVRIASGMGRRIILAEQTDGHPYRDSILAILEGQQFETQGQLIDRVQVIKAQFDKLPAPPSPADEEKKTIRQKIQAEIEEEVEAMLRQKDEVITNYRETAKKLEESIGRLVAEKDALEARIDGLTESRQYTNRREVESAVLEEGTSADEVRMVGDRVGVRRMTDPMLNAMRESLGRGSTGKTAFRELVESNGDKAPTTREHSQPGGELRITGYALSELAALAGLPPTPAKA